MACDEQARHVDVLCFTATNKSDTGRAVLPVEHHADESDTDRAVLPVAWEPAVENNEEEVQSNTSEEDHILNDSDAPDDSHLNDANTSSAVRPGDSEDIAEDNKKDAQQASETLDDNANAEPLEKDLDIAALDATTSAHDDWLHRGPFLFDMDFHTYIRFTVRKPRPKEVKVSDADRAEHIFLFDSCLLYTSPSPRD